MEISLGKQASQIAVIFGCIRVQMADIFELTFLLSFFLFWTSLFFRPLDRIRTTRIIKRSYLKFKFFFTWIQDLKSSKINPIMEDMMYSTSIELFSTGSTFSLPPKSQCFYSVTRSMSEIGRS